MQHQPLLCAVIGLLLANLTLHFWEFAAFALATWAMHSASRLQPMVDATAVSARSAQHEGAWAESPAADAGVAPETEIEGAPEGALGATVEATAAAAAASGPPASPSAKPNASTARAWLDGEADAYREFARARGRLANPPHFAVSRYVDSLKTDLTKTARADVYSRPAPAPAA